MAKTKEKAAPKTEKKGAAQKAEKKVPAKTDEKKEQENRQSTLKASKRRYFRLCSALPGEFFRTMRPFTAF